MTSTKSTKLCVFPAGVGPNELQEAPIVHKSKVPRVLHVSVMHTLPHRRYVICHTYLFPVIFAARMISFSLGFVSILPMLMIAFLLYSVVCCVQFSQMASTLPQEVSARPAFMTP